MIAEILSLTWWSIFLFGLKFLSAWLVAAVVVSIPFLILKEVLDRMKKGEFK